MAVLVRATNKAKCGRRKVLKDQRNLRVDDTQIKSTGEGFKQQAMLRTGKRARDRKVMADMEAKLRHRPALACPLSASQPAALSGSEPCLFFHANGFGLARRGPLLWIELDKSHLTLCYRPNGSQIETLASERL